MRFLAGPVQVDLLRTQMGETDLCCERREFYLAPTCETQEPPVNPETEYLKVDLGIANIDLSRSAKPAVSAGIVYGSSSASNVCSRVIGVAFLLTRKHGNSESFA